METLPSDIHEQLLKIRDLEQTVADLHKKLEEKQKPCPCQKIFSDDQRHFLAKGNIKGRGHSWSESTVKTGLKLRFSCGATGYDDLLSAGFPLPAISTLHQKTEHIQFESGILHEVFEMLEHKVPQLNEKEQWCAMSMDEMSIKKSIDFDVKSDSFLGFVTLPDHEGEASKAFCVQLGGLNTRWKQIVAYFFTGNSVDGSKIGPTMLEIMKCAHKIGLKVASLTNDFGSSNLACWS